MKTLKTLALATAVSASLLGSAGVMAASPGDLSNNSSTGDFIINLNLNTKIQITKLDDITLSYTNGAATGGMDFCVYTNNTNNKYRIKASATYEDNNGRVNQVSR